jgi:lipopolysaccharide transport system permease protein
VRVAASRHLDLILQLLQRELAQRHRATWLGGVWALLQPLGLLAVFTFVLTEIFRMRWPGAPGDAPVAYFAVMVLCGMVTYGIFSEALTRACTTVVANANLVKRVVFAVDVLPVVAVLAAVVNGLYGYLVLFAFSWATLGVPPVTALLLPAVLAPLFLWALGIGWFLAAFGVFVRDLPHALAVALQALYFLSPVLYTVEQVPVWAQGVIGLSPLAAVIGDVRDVLVGGSPPAWSRWFVTTATGGGTALAGWILFRRVKGAFADVL